MILLGLLAALAAFAALALGMDAHHRLLAGGPLARPRQRALRAGGAVLLLLSWLATIAAQGIVFGSVAWFGLIAAAAAIVLLTISARANAGR